MDKTKVLELVNKICNMESTECRSLNKSEIARELLKIANVPEIADIQEIPLDWNNQVVILFLLPNDANYYSLFAGIGKDKEFHFELAICGQLEGKDFNFYNEDKVIDINYFKGYDVLTKNNYTERKEVFKMKNLEMQWEDLNKNFVMSETSSITDDFHTGVFNAYVRVDKGNYNYDYIKQPFYYVVKFKRNEHRVFCIPISIEKKYF